MILLIMFALGTAIGGLGMLLFFSGLGSWPVDRPRRGGAGHSHPDSWLR